MLIFVYSLEIQLQFMIFFGYFLDKSISVNSDMFLTIVNLCKFLIIFSAKKLMFKLKNIDSKQLVIDLLTMLVHKQSQQTNQGCVQCTKNSNLIKKYEQLIKLYKKKQVRLSVDTSSRISNLKTSSHTIEISNMEVNCVKLAQVLSTSVRREYAQAWKGLNSRVEQKGQSKLALLVLSNLVNKTIKKNVLYKMQQYTSLAVLNEQENQAVLEEVNSKRIQQKGKEKQKGISVIQQFISESPPRFEQIQNSFLKTLSTIKEESVLACSQNLLKQKSKLELKISFLTLENSTLKQCLEDLNKRQQKQNQKKRDSLEMLAQEISEKNEEIVHLQTKLKKYQDRDQFQDNMLDEDRGSLKIQVERLEALREKLNGDIEKTREKVQELEVKLKDEKDLNEKLKEQCTQLRKKSFQTDVLFKNCQKLKKQLQKTIKKLQNKQKRFITYQKQLQLLTQGQTQLTNYSTALTQQLKTEFILLFLYNISDSKYHLQHSNLFDEQEIQFLNKFKENWAALDTDIKMHHLEHNKNHEHEISGIEGRGGQMESIFQALDESPRESREKQGLTMKMLELQLDKKRQIQKISELKQKFFHTRMIVLNLLKSLELQSSIKSECLDILRVLFDLFEYSQQERDSIFVKKKKLFSFL